MDREIGGAALHVGAWFLLIALSGLVALLTVRTVGAIARGRICIPE